MLVDNRDGRVVSPFQGWFPVECSDNAASSVNIITERNQVISPQQGYYMMLFAVVTLQTFKLTLVISMDCAQGSQCGYWDAQSARALAHRAFQPFDWPIMSNTSPTVVDVKVKVRGEIGRAHV